MKFQLTSAIAAVTRNGSGMQAPLIPNTEGTCFIPHGASHIPRCNKYVHAWGVSNRHSCIPRLPWQKHPHGFPDGMLDRGQNAVDELCDSRQAGVAARVRMGAQPHSKARVLDVVAGYEAEQVQGQPEVRLQAA